MSLPFALSLKRILQIEIACPYHRCNGDYDRSLKVECFQEKYGGSHKLLGSCVTNLNQLISLGSGGGLKLHRDGHVRMSLSSCCWRNISIVRVYCHLFRKRDRHC